MVSGGGRRDDADHRGGAPVRRRKRAGAGAAHQPAGRHDGGRSAGDATHHCWGCAGWAGAGVAGIGGNGHAAGDAGDRDRDLADRAAIPPPERRDAAKEPGVGDRSSHCTEPGRQRMSGTVGTAKAGTQPAPMVRRGTQLPPVRSEWGETRPEQRHKTRRKRQRVVLTRADRIQRALLATPLVAAGFAVWAFGGVYGWAYGIAYGLIFAGLGTWATLCLLGVLRACWRPVYWALAAYGAWVGVQYFTGLSFVPSATTSAAVHLGAGGALFVLVSQCYSGDRDAGWITAAFSVFTGALALLAILQAETGAQGIYWHFTYLYASPAGSFVN